MALKTTNRRHSYVRDKIRIFTIRFFGTAPAWITRKVQHRCQTLLCAPTPDFHRHGRKHFVDQRLIPRGGQRSEEHTSELQSPCNLVCRLLLEKKKRYMHSRRSR